MAYFILLEPTSREQCADSHSSTNGVEICSVPCSQMFLWGFSLNFCPGLKRYLLIYHDEAGLQVHFAIVLPTCSILATSYWTHKLGYIISGQKNYHPSYWARACVYASHAYPNCRLIPHQF
uniref:Uncharacterized protein n=1 Tax=Myotis myotis TaxID=51298 RepID=A0A7J7V3V6_MYOMY|nr:hypothetical protein mMyoMyo1_008530 [Myotis myotis]